MITAATEELHGHVTDVAPNIDGDELAVAATSGDTVLTLLDTADFDEDGGTVRIDDGTDAGLLRGYTAVTETPPTITLDESVPALPAGARVDVWDSEDGADGQPVVVYEATVIDDTTGDVVLVNVSHDLVDKLRASVRPGTAESVVCRLDEDGQWWIADVLGRVPLVDGSFIDEDTLPAPELPPTSDGVPPAESPTPVVRGTIGALVVAVPEVNNPDPATVDVWVSTVTPVALTGTPTYSTPGDGPSLTFVRTVGGQPVAAGTTYYVVVRARDADGNGPASAEASGTPAQVTGPDIAADAVTANLLIANDALIEALQTVDLSTVNLQAVNIDGGSIVIASSQSGSYPQAFSGTTFPAGWTNTKTNATGTGSGDPNIPGASVVATGPAGQNGSAVLFDIPATAGRTGTSGAVTTSVPPAADAEVSLRYWIDRSPRVNLHLAVRQQGLPNGFDEDFVGVDLSGDLGAFHIVSRVNGDDVQLATIDLGTTASILGRWLRVRFRIIAGQVQLKVWRETDTEPDEWTVAQQAGVLTPGNVALEWWVVPPSAGSGLDYTQQFWVDQLDVVTYATGFKVNPDGTGEWPSFAAALLNSPALTGTPTAPTPPPGDDDTSIATTEYVQGELAGTDWIDIAPASPLTAVSTQPPRWRIDGAGNVHIRGAVNRVTATSGVTVFTLPAEARPTGLVAVPVRTNAVGTVGQLTVNVNGTVVLTFAGTPSALGLEVVFSTHANP